MIIGYGYDKYSRISIRIIFIFLKINAQINLSPMHQLRRLRIVVYLCHSFPAGLLSDDATLRPFVRRNARMCGSGSRPRNARSSSAASRVAAGSNTVRRSRRPASDSLRAASSGVRSAGCSKRDAYISQLNASLQR